MHVEEKDVDLSEALGNQNEIFAEQAKAGITASDEDVEISQQNLKRDLEARTNKVNEALEQAEKLNQSAPQGPTKADVDAIDQLKAREKPVEEKPDRSPQEILEELGLKENPKKRSLTYGETTQEYIQKPLSFLGKIQFLSYIGEVMDKAMSGQNALQLNSLFEVPSYRGDSLSAQDFSDAQTFVQAVGKILVYAPDFLTKSYAIWLRVPEYDREWFALAMEESLSDDEGIDIIETFIDQNWGTLQSFFNERLPKLRDRLSARYRVSQSEQSKR